MILTVATIAAAISSVGTWPSHSDDIPLQPECSDCFLTALSLHQGGPDNKCPHKEKSL